jgi:hypothetical protein
MKPRKPSQPQGTPRLRLSATFVEALESDFANHGVEIIEALRKDSPRAYAELVGRLIQTTDAPDTKGGFKDCNSQRDIGLRLLLSMGMQEGEITDEQVDLAVVANQNFIARLEEIAGTKGRDLN